MGGSGIMVSTWSGIVSFFPPEPLLLLTMACAARHISHLGIFHRGPLFVSLSHPVSLKGSCNLPYRSESQLWGRLVIFQRVSVSLFKTGSCLYWSNAVQLHTPASHARFSRITKERGWSGNPEKKGGGSSMK